MNAQGRGNALKVCEYACTCGLWVAHLHVIMSWKYFSMRLSYIYVFLCVCVCVCLLVVNYCEPRGAPNKKNRTMGAGPSSKAASSAAKAAPAAAKAPPAKAAHASAKAAHAADSRPAPAAAKAATVAAKAVPPAGKAAVPTNLLAAAEAAPAPHNATMIARIRSILLEHGRSRWGFHIQRRWTFMGHTSATCSIVVCLLSCRVHAQYFRSSSMHHLFCMCTSINGSIKPSSPAAGVPQHGMAPLMNDIRAAMCPQLQQSSGVSSIPDVDGEFDAGDDDDDQVPPLPDVCAVMRREVRGMDVMRRQECLAYLGYNGSVWSERVNLKNAAREMKVSESYLVALKESFTCSGVTDLGLDPRAPLFHVGEAVPTSDMLYQYGILKEYLLEKCDLGTFVRAHHSEEAEVADGGDHTLYQYLMTNGQQSYRRDMKGALSLVELVIAMHSPLVRSFMEVNGVVVEASSGVLLKPHSILFRLYGGESPGVKDHHDAVLFTLIIQLWSLPSHAHGLALGIGEVGETIIPPMAPCVFSHRCKHGHRPQPGVLVPVRAKEGRREDKYQRGTLVVSYGYA